VVLEEWPALNESCPRDAETNARTPAMFTFYDASGKPPAYALPPAPSSSHIAIVREGDGDGSPCYEAYGGRSSLRNGTWRFFCDPAGGLTSVKWFADANGVLKNPACDLSMVPDEISYGAHRINWRNDLAECLEPNLFDLKRGDAFAKIEGSCGSSRLSKMYAGVDGRVGPFADMKPYAFPIAQRREGPPWGCSTEGCVKARGLGYDI
jgi:hypothetical protein